MHAVMLFGAAMRYNVTICPTCKLQPPHMTEMEAEIQAPRKKRICLPSAYSKNTLPFAGIISADALYVVFLHFKLRVESLYS